jgi:hypothetical protein
LYTGTITENFGGRMNSKIAILKIYCHLLKKETIL